MKTEQWIGLGLVVVAILVGVLVWRKLRAEEPHWTEHRDKRTDTERSLSERRW